MEEQEVVSRTEDMFLANNLPSLTVKQLKEYLRLLDLPLSGLKADLVSRVHEHLSLSYDTASTSASITSSADVASPDRQAHAVTRSKSARQAFLGKPTSRSASSLTAADIEPRPVNYFRQDMRPLKLAHGVALGSLCYTSIRT